MKDLLRRLVKDGEVTLFEGPRAKNRDAADKLVEAAIKAGYSARRVNNCFGYIVVCE